MEAKTTKELALNLIDQIIYLEHLQDSELQALKKEKDSSLIVTGKSVVRFHLELLKELIEAV